MAESVWVIQHARTQMYVGVREVKGKLQGYWVRDLLDAQSWDKHEAIQAASACRTLFPMTKPQDLVPVEVQITEELALKAQGG